jgi:hypothetical protein
LLPTSPSFRCVEGQWCWCTWRRESFTCGCLLPFD